MKSLREYLLLIFFIFCLNFLYSQHSDSYNYPSNCKNFSNDTVCAQDNLDSLFNLNSYEDAVILAQQYVDSSLLTNDSTKIANALLILGIMQENKGDNIDAFETLLNAYTIFKTTGNQIGIALTMDHLGTVFRYHGSQQKSLEYHTKAYEIFKQGNHSYGLINALNNLGIINRQLGNDKQAFKYHQQALNLAIENKSSSISSIYISIGTYYWYKGVNDSALYYYKSALNIPTVNLPLKERHCAALNNIGNVFRSMHKYDSALYYYNLAINESKLYHTRNLESVNLKNLGRIYTLIGKYDKANNYFQSSLVIAKEINLKKVILENYFWLGELFEKQQDYKTALLYFKKHAELENVILAEKQHTEINQLERDFSIEQAEKEQVIKLKENSEKNLILQKRKTSEIIYFAILLFLLSSALFTFFQYRTKKRSNLQLLKLNEELEKKVEDRTKSLLDAKQKAEDSKANITAILEGTNDSIWAFDRNYQILYINQVMQQEFLQTFGVLLEPGKSLVESLPEQLIPIWKPRYDRVLANEQFSTEDAVPTENGTLYIQVVFNPIIKNEKVIGGSCFGSDITDRKNAEIQLIEAKEKAEESEEQLKRIANSFVDGMIYQVAMPNEEERKFNYISDAVTRLYGCTPEQAMEDPNLVYGKLHPEDVGELINLEKEALKTMSVFKTECRVINPDGTIRWSYYVSQPRTINNVVCWDGIEVDITKQKLIEDELIRARDKAEKNEIQLNAILEKSPTGFAINKISTGEVTYVNKAFADAYHIPIELCTNVSTFFEYVYGDQMEMANKILDDINSNDPERMKWEVVPITEKKTKEIFYVTASNMMLRKLDLMISTVTDITSQVRNEGELKKAKEKAEESGEKFRKLSANVPDLIFQFTRRPDGSYYVPIASDGIKNVFGCSPEDVLDSFEPIAKVIHPEDADRVISDIEYSATHLAYFASEFRVQIPGREIQWIYSRSTPEKLDDGSITWYGFNVNITQRKKIEDELIKAKEKAEESDRLKSAFLANMSHEIRTPMNGILGFTNLLLQPDLSGEEQEKYIDIIKKSGDRMLTTVNDIIDISRIEAGLEELNASEININEQMNYLYSFFKPEAEKKGIKLVYKNELAEKEHGIVTDPDKFNSILTNLIKNAIKYTEKGVVEFGYALINKDQTQELKFYIKDTGIGIPKNRQKAIFDRFVQADIEDIQAKQGSGLGLAISKVYAEMMGGNIWVDSKEGKGSTFYFSIKQMPVSKAKPSIIDNQIKEEENLREKLNILVVEDDETSQQFISLVLEKLANKIIMVQSGLEAVEISKKDTEIHLILMDIQLPGMNGYEATKEIRKFNKEVIIIAQTAYALAGDKEKAIEAGCNDYITKPINQEELVYLIKKYWEK